MGGSAIFSLHLCVLGLMMLAALFCHGAIADGSKRDNRPSAYAGIYPFLRTGRAHEEGAFKRSRPGTNLMAFPRVGRGGGAGAGAWSAEEAVGLLQKKGESPQNVNNGMWFGPRLGRVEKRGDNEVPWAYFYFSGDYTPRLGRESEEMPDEEDMDNKESFPEEST